MLRVRPPKAGRAVKAAPEPSSRVCDHAPCVRQLPHRQSGPRADFLLKAHKNKTSVHIQSLHSSNERRRPAQSEPRKPRLGPRL
jgi:hypothetical protein